MTHDLYPSRRQPHPEIRRRLDPVVHGRPGPDAPIPAELVNFYDENGYLVFENFFSRDEGAAMQKEMKALRGNPDIRDHDWTITEPGSGAIRSIFRIHELSPAFGALAKDPRLVALAEFLLGDRVYIHQSRLNYKPGFRGKEFYWHSDFETWHVEDGMPRMRAFSISITLSENNEFNGPLMLIPGSHRSFVACVGETPEDHYKQSLKRQEYGVPDDDSLRFLVNKGGIVAPKGPPGTLILFDCNIMHGSNGNITPYDRSNLFLVYNSLENRLLEPFGAARPRPEFIAARDNVTPLPSPRMAAA